MITKRPKGTGDWYGEDMYKRTLIEEKIRKICKTYNISEIITPIFEHTVLFHRGVGETTDVVQKEMYSFEDKGRRNITLKPEGTAGVVRAYLENSLYAETQPTKLYYITPAFRYEKPESGRLRQHHQFGIEFFGSPSPLAEVELISLLTEFMKDIGIRGASLHINSIGCKSCRKTYNEALINYLESHKENLCMTCIERMYKNPLRVLDCKAKECELIVKDAPKTIDYLDDECREHFNELKDLLDKLNIDYKVDPTIVRGLDYYNKTVFEFLNKDGFTLCGGGRYDGLINEIDEKRDIPAVGFGFGIERMIGELKQEGVLFAEKPSVDLYIGVLGNQAKASAYNITRSLREKGIIVETDYMNRSVKAQMKYANKIEAKNTLIIGLNEINERIVKVKNMDTGEETEINMDKIYQLFE